METITRNITFNLPADLIRRAKIYAAEHELTVNGFVRLLLDEALSGQFRAQAAADRLLGLAEEGLSFSADLSSIRRAELHERR